MSKPPTTGRGVGIPYAQTSASLIIEFLSEARSELIDADAYYDGELSGL